MARFGLQFYLGLLLFAVAISKCPAQEEEATKEQDVVPPAPENANGSDWIYMTAPDESAVPKDKEARQSGDQSFAASGTNSQAGGASASGFAFAGAGTNTQLPNIQKNCGLIPPNQSPDTAYPWMVAIVSWNDEFIASGVLLTDSLVLTNAHSIIDFSHKKQPLKIIIGGANFPLKDQRNVFYVAAAAIHPNYGPFAPENDIALLRTFENINTEFVTICISTFEADYQNTQATCKALGWADYHTNPPCQIRKPASLSALDVKLSTCPNYPCFEAPGGLCNGNAGSAIICKLTENTTDERYFIWGLLPDDRTCVGGAPPGSITFPVVSTFSNLAFISKYFSTPNPFISNRVL